MISEWYIVLHTELMTEDWQRLKTRGVATSAEAFAALRITISGSGAMGMGRSRPVCLNAGMMGKWVSHGGVEGIRRDRGMCEC